MRHMATHDTLTSLPNRLLFRDRLAMAYERSKRNGKMFALAYLDVDDFKAVNDAWGHRCGDEVLACIGERLASQTRSSDTAARLGGDEFAVLFEEFEAETDPPRRMDAICQVLEQPMHYLKEGSPSEITVRVSRGLALYPRDGDSPEQLLHVADQAMYAKKRERLQQADAPGQPEP